MNSKQIKDLATLAGFLRTTSNRCDTTLTCTPCVLKIRNNGAWGFYTEGTEGKPPDMWGADHSSLSAFLNAQLWKN
jgi:hypothetical protein